MLQISSTVIPLYKYSLAPNEQTHIKAFPAFVTIVHYKYVHSVI